MSKTLEPTVQKLASAIYRGLGTPLSLKLEKALIDGDWLTIASAKLSPVDYRDAHTFGCDSLAVALLKKYPHLPLKIDRRQAAVDIWWSAEKQCYATNERLCRYLPEFCFSADLDERVVSLLADIRKEVEYLIGPCPPVLLDGRFGPGATLTDRGGGITILHKMSNPQPTLTTDAVWFLPQWLSTLWGKSFASKDENKLSFVKGNRFTTVPKTALTDRAIAVEPSVNVFYQLGVGSALRARLRSRGWDLDVAADLHRHLAREGSRSGDFCTLDLSSASDTVAKVLVKLLLPPRWFSIMDDLRSKFTLINGKWVHLEKFSSMGNGYTFELETIIFSAISCAVSKRLGFRGELGKDIFVFGDDIIAPNAVYLELGQVLAGLGFSVNQNKSFHDGPFRESCGGDFFDGWPVRGFYLKKPLSSPDAFISAFNGLRRALMEIYPAGLPDTLRSALLDLRRATPSWVQQCRGPAALGDIVFHDKPERWTVRVKHGIRYVRCYRAARFAKAHLGAFPNDIQLAALIYAFGSSGGIPLRDGVRGYKCAWVPFS